MATFPYRLNCTVIRRSRLQGFHSLIKFIIFALVVTVNCVSSFVILNRFMARHIAHQRLYLFLGTKIESNIVT